MVEALRGGSIEQQALSEVQLHPIDGKPVLDIRSTGRERSESHSLMMGIKMEVDVPLGVVGELLESNLMNSSNGRNRTGVDIKKR